jgi:simple sugar transport system ATP-binding protein
MPSSTPAVELTGICKRFGPVAANQDVDLSVVAGHVHGIVGENGAGKSTLMSILYGYYQADAGVVRIDGRARAIAEPRDAIEAGIGMVHQHFMLVENLTVLDNVMLGAEGHWRLRRGRHDARQALGRLERDYGLDVDLNARIDDLAVGLRQRVEILKALYRGAQTLILDEPTGVLTPQETARLFDILTALKGQGVTTLLITHKLREIMAVTDRVSVMRGGRMVADRDTADTDESELAELMVGRKVLLTLDKQPAVPGEPALTVESLSHRDRHGVDRVDRVSFQLRRGEILGIAGVSGNGQSELLEVLSGMRSVSGGRFELSGHRVDAEHPSDPATLRALGMAHVPEDRQAAGMVGAFSAAETSILGHHADPAFNGRFLSRSRTIRAHCGELMSAFDVRPPNPALRSAAFSGGNQQKLILAREMQTHPRVLLVGQPTRGVDIGAIEFIHRQLLSLRDAGAALLLVSVELEEILSLSDRILVMFEGRVVGELAAHEADERLLGLMMANAHQPTGPSETAA